MFFLEKLDAIIILVLQGFGFCFKFKALTEKKNLIQLNLIKFRGRIPKSLKSRSLTLVKMETGVKIVLSIVLGFVGFLCLGLWPYIPGPGVLISIGLFGAAIMGIVAIWKKRPVQGEGDVFKNKDKLNKD